MAKKKVQVRARRAPTAPSRKKRTQGASRWPRVLRTKFCPSGVTIWHPHQGAPWGSW